MRYARLGERGPTVSTIGFGAWAIGRTNWGRTDDEVSRHALHAALDQGVTLIDTADVYGFGHSEELIAGVIGERGKGDVVCASSDLCALIGEFNPELNDVSLPRIAACTSRGGQSLQVCTSVR